jgi:5-methylthioadenosine/S-adenosylhomocysteine deaminase
MRSCAVAPHAPYTVSDENLLKCKALSVKHGGLRIHTHLHETKAECVDSAAQNKSSMSCHRSDQKTTPVINFARLGLLDHNLIAVHMTQLTSEEIKLVASHKANISHCPTSNLKLASGICPVSDLIAAGVNVALGTDSSASNNALDMLFEMKLSAILAKGSSHDPTAVPAAVALKMATLNGARAIGMDDKIGSLKIGKAADFIAVQ